MEGWLSLHESEWRVGRLNLSLHGGVDLEAVLELTLNGKLSLELEQRHRLGTFGKRPTCKSPTLLGHNF